MAVVVPLPPNNAIYCDCEHTDGTDNWAPGQYPPDNVFGYGPGVDPPLPPPNLTSLNPATVSLAAGATTVSFLGSDFVDGAQVSFDNNVTFVPATFVSATELSAPYTPTATGNVWVLVKNPDGQLSGSGLLTIGA
jgi:IPT/TIG domain